MKEEILSGILEGYLLTRQTISALLSKDWYFLVIPAPHVILAKAGICGVNSGGYLRDIVPDADPPLAEIPTGI